jgi:hypothetical protein
MANWHPAEPSSTYWRSSTYWVHVRLFYPGADVDDDRRQELAEELRLLQRLRPQGTATTGPEGTTTTPPPVEAHMRGRLSGSIEAPAAPVPLMVAVFSNNDILFEGALIESIAAIERTGMLWAVTVKYGDTEHTEASTPALDLIRLMMADVELNLVPSWVPRWLLRFRDMMGSRRVLMGSGGHDGR